MKRNEQELALNIQILQEQARIIASNVEKLTMYLQELNMSKTTVDGLKTLKKGDEILVPVGASTFIRARIEDTAGLIMGVGANVSVDRSVDEAATSLEEKITIIESKIKENQEAYIKVAQKLDELNAEAQKLMGNR